MTEREYLWTAEGRASADAAGVTYAEVIQALYAVRHTETTTPDNALLVVLGEAATGRIVLVMADRVSRRHQRVFRIVWVRRASPMEIEEWRRRTT